YKAATINAKNVVTIKIVTKEIHKINAVTIAKMPLKIRKISTENNLNKILQPENQKVEMQLKSVIHVIITNVTINAIMIVAIVRTKVKTKSSANHNARDHAMRVNLKISQSLLKKKLQR